MGQDYFQSWIIFQRREVNGGRLRRSLLENGGSIMILEPFLKRVVGEFRWRDDQEPAVFHAGAGKTVARLESTLIFRAWPDVVKDCQ